MARKLASIRSLFRTLLEHGEIDANPADLLPAPQLPHDAAARRSSRRTSRALLDRIPAATPLEQRDRALFELAYACGLRAEELVDLDVGSASTSTPSRCASRARAPRPASCPPASPR